MKHPLHLALLMLAPAACATGAHHTTRGSVVMLVDAREAHVCMGEGEVRPGDAVRLIRHKCVDSHLDNGLPAPPRCTREVVGGGEVVQVLNEHYSVVRFAPGVVFAEGDTVERER